MNGVEKTMSVSVIATVLGLLALFCFVSIRLSGDDSGPQVDPRDALPVWARFALR